MSGQKERILRDDLHRYAQKRQDNRCGDPTRDIQRSIVDARPPQASGVRHDETACRGRRASMMTRVGDVLPISATSVKRDLNAIRSASRE